MCWVCDADKSSIATSYWGNRLGTGSLHLQTAAASAWNPDVDNFALGTFDWGTSYKLTDAMPADGVGDLKPVSAAQVAPGIRDRHRLLLIADSASYHAGATLHTAGFVRQVLSDTLTPPML